MPLGLFKISAVFSLAFVFLQASASAQAAEPVRNHTDANLEQRVNELEEQLKSINEWYTNYYVLGKGRVSPLLTQSLYLGGYFETAATHLQGPDMKRQTSVNSHTLALNLTAPFNEQMKFVTQLSSRLEVPLANVDNNPNLNPPKRQFAGANYFSVPAHGYFEYALNDYFNVQVGLGFTPFGIMYLNYEPELFRLRGGSQMLAYDFTDGSTIGIASPIWTGLHIYGSFSEAKNSGYHLYSLTTIHAVDSVGVGARLWYRLMENATIGTSVQTGSLPVGQYLSHGFDIDLRFAQFGVISEYAYSRNSDGVLDNEIYYIEPYMNLTEQWVIFLNTEYIDTPARTDYFTGIPNPVKKWRCAAGFNWLPIANARFRVVYLFHDYIDEADSIAGQERDYQAIDLSMAVAF